MEKEPKLTAKGQSRDLKNSNTTFKKWLTSLGGWDDAFSEREPKPQRPQKGNPITEIMSHALKKSNTTSKRV